MNVCCINFAVFLCLMNIKAEDTTIIYNVIDFTIVVTIKKVIYYLIIFTKEV